MANMRERRCTSTLSSYNYHDMTFTTAISLADNDSTTYSEGNLSAEEDETESMTGFNENYCFGNTVIATEEVINDMLPLTKTMLWSKAF